MKKLLYACLVAIMVFIVGCEQNGDEGYYDNQYRIYFLNDSVYFPLGDQPVTVTTYEADIPVKILGMPAREKMKFKVKVNERKTTAPAASYAEIPGEIEILEDSVNAIVPVRLIRANIPSEVDTVFRLVLELEENENFQLGINEKLQTVVMFGNYLAKPEWWMGLEYYCIGAYHPLKYQKLIEIWGGPVALDDYFNKMTKLIIACREMYDYFQEHPEYGMTFPEDIVWPYE